MSRASYMLSYTTINLKMYSMVGIRHFAKLAETSERLATNNFKRSLTPAQIEPGKKANNKGMSNHTLSENFLLLKNPKHLQAIILIIATYHAFILYYHIRQSKSPRKHHHP